MDRIKNNNNDNDSNNNNNIVSIVGMVGKKAGYVMQSITSKKYNLPDKTVASQILMYRQLLHTSCRPGLKLTRPYQGTPAQVSVQHMPWWTTTKDPNDPNKTLTMVDTKKMEISYDNLITRLWYSSGCGGGENNIIDTSISPPIPHENWIKILGFQQTDPVTDFRSGGVLSLAMMVYIVESCPNTYEKFCNFSNNTNTNNNNNNSNNNIHQHPAYVLPFAITSINITDMMSKFLMLSKSTDRMDVLLSQKPFWYMFSDPYALLACQELSLNILLQIVYEIHTIRYIEDKYNNNNNVDENDNDDDDNNNINNNTNNSLVTVFDFAHILSITEQRVEYDLLGTGPTTVQELRNVYEKITYKYDKELQQKIQRIKDYNNKKKSNNKKSTIILTSNNTSTNNSGSSRDVKVEQAEQVDGAQHTPGNNNNNNFNNKEQILKQHAVELGAAATGFAGNVFSKIKSTSQRSFRNLSINTTTTTTPTNKIDENKNNNNNVEEQVDFAIIPPSVPNGTKSNLNNNNNKSVVDLIDMNTTPPNNNNAKTTTTTTADDDDWVKTIVGGDDDQDVNNNNNNNFSIGDEDDVDLLL